MSARLLFSIGCAIFLAGFAITEAGERFGPRLHVDGVALARVAKGIRYFGVAVAAFAMIAGLIIG